MKTELIAETWDALGSGQRAFVEAFYQRFFERYPDYRPLFPLELNPQHLEKMVQTMALVANLSDDRGSVAPHMHRVGEAHRAYGLTARDFDNFKRTFLELLGERVGARWSAAAQQAWSDAFDAVIVPLMREGVARRS
ncbi:MAG: globin [Burkholderiales bacterium]|nr:globin [Burkholderiales bacterium]